MSIESGTTVKIKGWRGIAFYVCGPVRVFEPEVYFFTDPDTGEEYSETTGDGEWIDGDGSSLRVVMVGDDRVHEVDADDCTPISDGEYCGSCGQIGCCHG